jgi:hypothetical protein
LKKGMLSLAATLAVVLVAAAPAMAQVEQGFEQDTDSGDVDQSFTVTGGGSAANQCAAILAAAQSGNLQNTDGSIQSDSDIEEAEQEEIGSDLTLSPELAEECEQTINQASAASGAKEAPKTAPNSTSSSAPKNVDKPETSGKAESKKDEEKKDEVKKGEKSKEERKELPKTGGVSGGTVSLISLGAFLLVGGLLARKMSK